MKVNPVINSFSKLIPVAKTEVKNAVSNPIKNHKTMMSAAAASAIAAATMVRPKTKEVSVQDIENKLLENNYIKDNLDDCFVRTLSKKEEKEIDEQFGNLANSYKNLIAKPIYYEDIEEMRDFINLNKKNSQNIINNNFKNFLTLYLILESQKNRIDYHELCEENKNYLSLINNIVNNKLDVDNIQNCYSYKIDTSSNWNYSLRQKAENNIEIPDYLEPKINKMVSYIDTQNIEKPIKLYRGEGFQVLNNIKLQNGETVNLGNLMRDTGDNPENESKVKEILLDNEISAVQHGFLSTSMDKSLAKRFARNHILWEFTTEPNTKGLYIEGVNLNGIFSDEKEVLLQKDSKITIQSADYDGSKNSWYIKAKVSN
ncbi:hypothetical protein IJ732_07425 [bacterium]|nr:hypothetical protein [bacterium]